MSGDAPGRTKEILTENKLLRVAAYCRVSTQKDDQLNSFENQREYFESAICTHEGWKLTHIYADEGRSGTSTKKRPEFLKMIDEALSGGFDLILTKEVSRFARNTVDTLAYTRKLKEHGIGVLFLLDHINTLDSDGELRLSIMATLAQEESRKVSERVKWGQTQRMRQGVVFGRPPLGYLLSQGNLVPEPEGAELVRSIYYRYLEEHKGSEIIARELQREGQISGRGNVSWSAATVIKILKNEKYCGDLVQKKTYTPDYLTHHKKYNRGEEQKITLYDHHPAIISRTDWQRAQEELHRRRRGGNEKRGSGTRWPLSGKLLCGVCGHTMAARKKKNAEGKTYVVWRCVNRNCPGPGYQVKNEQVIGMLRSVQSDREKEQARAEERVFNLVRSLALPTKSGDQLEREYIKLEARRGMILEAFLKGKLSAEEKTFLSERYRRELERLSKLGTKKPQTVRVAQTDTRNIDRTKVFSSDRDDQYYAEFLEYAIFYTNKKADLQLFGFKGPCIFSREDQKHTENKKQK